MNQLRKLLSFVLISSLISSTGCQALTLPEPIKSFGHRMNLYAKCIRGATQEERKKAKELIVKDGAIFGSIAAGFLIVAGATILLIKKSTQPTITISQAEYEQAVRNVLQTEDKIQEAQKQYEQAQNEYEQAIDEWNQAIEQAIQPKAIEAKNKVQKTKAIVRAKEKLLTLANAKYQQTEKLQKAMTIIYEKETVLLQKAADKHQNGKLSDQEYERLLELRLGKQ